MCLFTNGLQQGMVNYALLQKVSIFFENVGHYYYLLRNVSVFADIFRNYHLSLNI